MVANSRPHSSPTTSRVGFGPWKYFIETLLILLGNRQYVTPAFEAGIYHSRFRARPHWRKQCGKTFSAATGVIRQNQTLQDKCVGGRPFKAERLRTLAGEDQFTRSRRLFLRAASGHDRLTATTRPPNTVFIAAAVTLRRW